MMGFKVKTILIFISCLIAVGLYSQPTSTLGITLGMLWGGVNLYFIKELLYEILIVTPKNYLRLFFMAFLKFPLLYAAGYALLVTDISAWYLLIGFTLSLAFSPIYLHHYKALL